ncbi:hypothetical protein CSOJ01_10011 [Colletotrichum sojae]|uniref:Uncharacterized protein n=1 Tax=Colletotrichum sojae TaxID=2175907 RepID=A0A8H6MPU6_9PEZI|nr:hypothetical protein CSOJ01_10011 [Colletotrichum sojae]
MAPNTPYLSARPSSLTAQLKLTVKAEKAAAALQVSSKGACLLRFHGDMAPRTPRPSADNNDENKISINTYASELLIVELMALEPLSPGN